MRKLKLAALGALLVGTTALAAPPPSIIYTAGVYTIPSNIDASIFENFASGVPGTQYDPTFHNATSGYKERVDGQDLVGLGSVPSVYANPQSGSTSQYLAVGSGFAPGSFGVNFGTGVTVFSYVFGSLDSYNTLILTLNDGTKIRYDGQQIDGTGGAPTGYAHYTDSGRVTYDTLGLSTITDAAFFSSNGAFEIDSLAAATPEPGTWAMMILGFGLAGAALRSRRRKGTLAIA